ncbi:unnamed protein product, partial [Amoebophrya sp. A25]
GSHKFKLLSDGEHCGPWRLVLFDYPAMGATPDRGMGEMSEEKFAEFLRRERGYSIIKTTADVENEDHMPNHYSTSTMDRCYNQRTRQRWCKNLLNDYAYVDIRKEEEKVSSTMTHSMQD